MPITVSIIVPLFNRGKFLPQLFNTFKQQTFEDFELILIDDGSTDNTEEWIKENSNLLTQKIIYQKQENAGPYSARNLGLSLASGKFIAFQDSDDEWPDYHLKEFVDILEENNDIDWILGSIKRIDHQSGEVVEPSNLITKEGKPHPFTTLQTQKQNLVYKITDPQAGMISILHSVPGSTQCAMIRTELFKELIFDETYRTAYDRFFAIKSILKGFTFAFVEKTHQIYHIHNDHISLVNNFDPAKLEKSAKTMIRGYNSLEEFCHNKSEHNAIKQRLAEVYAWELSIAYRSQKKYRESTEAMRMALTYKPLSLIYLKSFLANNFLLYFNKVFRT